MQILGIDYGRKKIGLAIGDTDPKMAEPYSVIRFKTISELVDKIEQVVQVEQVGQVVVGVSEGKTAQDSREFGKKLEEKLGIPVAFQDETLTTQEAQELSIKAQIKRKKRRKLEDAYSATLILQSYLDSR